MLASVAVGNTFLAQWSSPIAPVLSWKSWCSPLSCVVLCGFTLSQSDSTHGVSSCSTETISINIQLTGLPAFPKASFGDARSPCQMKSWLDLSFAIPRTGRSVGKFPAFPDLRQLPKNKIPILLALLSTSFVAPRLQNEYYAPSSRLAGE